MLIPFILYLLPLTFLMYANSRCLRLYPAAKTIASCSFLATAIFAAAHSGAWHHFLLLLPGLLMSFGGDLALGFHKKTGSRLLMGTGFLFFLLAQICFCVGLSRLQPLVWYDFIFPLLMTVVIAILNRRPYIEVKPFAPVSLVYAFCVSLFCAKGMHILFADPTAANVWLGLGAALFFCSDFLIYFRFFCKKEFPGKRTIYLFIYYIATFLLAGSIYWCAA